jgi:hypothetical protein
MRPRMTLEEFILAAREGNGLKSDAELEHIYRTWTQV